MCGGWQRRVSNVTKLIQFVRNVIFPEQDNIEKFKKNDGSGSISYHWYTYLQICGNDWADKAQALLNSLGNTTVMLEIGKLTMIVLKVKYTKNRYLASRHTPSIK